MDKSIALRYDRDLPAPFVSARGRGELAKKLVALAQEYDVPVVAANELTESLFYLEVGDFIPEPFYRVVAELLAFVWKSTSAPTGATNHRKQHGVETD